LGPALLGEHPRQIARIERRMDVTIGGHGHAITRAARESTRLYGRAHGERPCWIDLG
jgi:hypothetical protein